MNLLGELYRMLFAGGCRAIGLSGASSSVEESVASPVCADPLVFEELGLLNHFVMVAGSSPVILDVTFFTNDWKNIFFFNEST